MFFVAILGSNHTVFIKLAHAKAKLFLEAMFFVIIFTTVGALSVIFTYLS